MKPWLLKLHRWIALLFALPLAVVLFTGLVLSFEPWLVSGTVKEKSLSAPRVAELIAKHDPGGQARALGYRSYDNTLTIGAGRNRGAVVDVNTGEATPAPSALASLLGTMRRTHEDLVFDLNWLVVASSFAMLALAILGVLLGWPRIANTLGGWHKAMAWGLLPLIVLSPLTGLMLSYRISFTSPPAAPATPAAPPALAEAVAIVGKAHDLSSLIWLRPMGSGLAARLVEGGEYKVYAVTREGTTPMARNWPRLWHEGNFAGAWSALMNVVISLAMSGLLITGLWIWLRRRLKRRARRAERAQAAG